MVVNIDPSLKERGYSFTMSPVRKMAFEELRGAVHETSRPSASRAPNT